MKKRLAMVVVISAVLAAQVSHGGDAMAGLWSKISKMGKKKSVVPVATAGLRGSEQTKEDELKPYWKGNDKEKDKAAMSKIEELIEKKDFSGAIGQLKSFNTDFPDSKLQPVSALILAVCYSESGNKTDAVKTLEEMINKYPDHELVGDAKAALDQLKAGK